jgi:hypothetical protein
MSVTSPTLKPLPLAADVEVVDAPPPELVLGVVLVLLPQAANRPTSTADVIATRPWPRILLVNEIPFRTD